MRLLPMHFVLVHSWFPLSARVFLTPELFLSLSRSMATGADLGRGVGVFFLPAEFHDG